MFLNENTFGLIGEFSNRLHNVTKIINLRVSRIKPCVSYEFGVAKSDADRRNVSTRHNFVLQVTEVILKTGSTNLNNNKLSSAELELNVHGGYTILFQIPVMTRIPNTRLFTSI